METRTKVNINDYICRSCNLPANLNEAKVCEMCTNRVAEPYRMPWYGIAVMIVVVTAFVLVVLGLTAMKGTR
jgi:hypothetical protein